MVFFVERRDNRKQDEDQQQTCNDRVKIHLKLPEVTQLRNVHLHVSNNM